MIPLVNLTAQYERIRPEIMEKIDEVLESRAFIQGMYVSQFENRFVQAQEGKFGSGCSNGTAALYAALKALGVAHGDEVITTPHTFFATAEAIINVGATPVFADILPDTYCLDPAAVEAAVSERTKAIVPVHLYGTPSDMDAIKAIADKRKLLIVEDCAQAHLARYRGKMVGTFGEASSFSFFPGKNLGAYGDAGFVMTESHEVDVVVRRLIDHGRVSKYVHEIVGDNLRMDGLQAAILSVKLKYLPEWTRRRRENADHYRAALAGSEIKVMGTTPGSEPAYHLFVVEAGNREECMDYLKTKGVATSIHYPVPLHLQPALSKLGGRRGQFPNTEHAADRIISLPMCAELSAEQIDFISSELMRVARS